MVIVRRLLMAALLSLSAQSTHAQTAIPVEQLDQQHVDHETHHVQGLAVSNGSYWISSVDRQAKKGYVYHLDRATAKVTHTRELTFGKQFHPGGIELTSEALCVPVAEYRPRSTTTIVKLDPTTLATRASFTVEDHIGCIARVGGGELLAANWDARIFYRLSLTGQILERQDNPRPTAYQDLKAYGDLIVGCGTEKIDGSATPVVDLFDAKTLRLTKRLSPQGALRSGGVNFCREGCAVFDGSLFLMPEDGPHTTIYRFALPAN